MLLMNNNESNWEYLIPFLFLAILMLLIVVYLLVAKLKSKDKQLDDLRQQIESELSYPQFLEKAIQEPDIFVELNRLIYLKSEKISPTLTYFFEELADRAEFEMIGKYKEQVLFSPQLHRSRERIDQGENVEIVVPGWKYKKEIIRYPLVQKSKKGT